MSIFPELIKPISAVNGNSEFDGFDAQAINSKSSVASSSTWIIEDETVTIANTTFTYDGTIIIKREGRFVITNATLQLNQIVSWQYSIIIEETGSMQVNHSQLESKYPFAIVIGDLSNFTSNECRARHTRLIATDTSNARCENTRLLDIITTNESNINLHTCNFQEIKSRESSCVTIRNCNLANIKCEDNTRFVVDSSSVDFIVCDRYQRSNFTDSVLGTIRCWNSVYVFVTGCIVGDFRYSDLAKASILKSNLGYIQANGRLPLLLADLTIGTASLQGYANVTMSTCVVDTLTTHDNSILNFINSSSNHIYIERLSRAQIEGTPASPCKITEYIASHAAESKISWAQFDYIELGSNTKTTLTDSQANYLHNWCYETNTLDILRSNFTDFRISGATDATIANSSINRFGDMGSVNLTATHCKIYSLNLYSSSISRFSYCTIDTLSPWGEAQIALDESKAGLMINDEYGQLLALDSLPIGQLDYWNSNKSGSIKSFHWNLTVYYSEISFWNVHIRHNVDCIIKNCTLAWVPCYGSAKAAFVNVTLGDLSVGENANVLVENGEIQILQNNENGFVELINSNFLRLQTEGLSQVLIRSNFSGCSWYWIRHESRVIRELEVIVLDQLSNPISGAVVDVFKSDQTLIHQIHTDSIGWCFFNLTYTSTSSLAEIFTCRATYSGHNSSLQFDICASPPLIIFLDLSSPPLSLNEPNTQSVIMESNCSHQIAHDSMNNECQPTLIVLSFQRYLLQVSSVIVVMTANTFCCHITKRKRLISQVGKTRSSNLTFIGFKKRRFIS